MEMREEVCRIRCGSGNCYLVSNGGDAVLIDTARKKHRNKILRACRPFRVRTFAVRTARTVSCLSPRIYGRKTHTFSHRLLS